MASPIGSGTSSTSISIPHNFGSGSEDEYQHVQNERKRRRMLSNRESARRSRMRKQQHLDDLMKQVSQLREENNEIISRINVTTQLHLNVEAENAVLRAQMAELTHRLDSLNEMISFINSTNGYFEADDNDPFIINHPWSSICAAQQPIMASPDAFMC